MAAAVITIKEGVFADAPPVCTWVDAMSLAANTAETYTVPTNVDLIFFSCDDAKFYLRADGSAATITAAAGANVTNGTASALNPTFRRVERGQSLSLISPTNCVIYLECFARHK